MLFDAKFFFGIVEDREDPLKIGRLRIRVFGIHPEDQDKVPTDSLPWAMPIQWLQSAAASGIGWSPVGAIVGSRVFGFFMDQDMQVPIYIGTIGGGEGHLSFPGPTKPSTEQSKKPSPKAAAKLGQVSSDKSTKAAQLAKKLKDRYGLTDNQAAALVGNLSHESGLKPNVREGSAASGGGIGEPWPKGTKNKGYGYAQWTNSRLDDYIEYCEKNKLDPKTDEANYQFLCHELDTTHRSTITELKKTDTLEDGTKRVMDVFERPNPKYAHLDRRVNLASSTLKGMKGVDVPVRTAGVEEKETTPEDTSEQEAPDDQSGTETLGTEPPRAQYRGKYPYNKTFRSESGHLIEIDDTPGAERLLDYHTLGTYTEINEEGRRVVKVVSNNYKIVADDDNLYVEGNVNIFVNGNANMKVEGDLVGEIGGDATIATTGDLRLKAATVAIEATDGDINLKASGSILSGSDGDIHIKSGGNVNIDGSELHLNSGAAEDAQGTGTSTALTPENLSFVLDDDFDGEGLNEAVEDGMISEDILKQVPDKVDEDPKQGEPSGPSNGGCDGIEDRTDFPDSLKLSPNVTLGMVTKFAAAGGHTLAAQRGLTKGQIACNLSHLAKNVIEPIKAQYKNCLITSAFRTVKTGKSQHEIGQAVDMQFSGLTNAQYLDVAKWIRDSSGIKFDQLLLEHKNFGSGKSWIHVSYNKTGGRGQVLTLYNNKTYAQGLTNVKA